ncbi:MAG: endo-1,4-beta-xylanase [Spirochaetes bacterium]|nr:endo-1,4-beta-xylanase [Spirochaetota bacterium]
MKTLAMLVLAISGSITFTVFAQALVIPAGGKSVISEGSVSSFSSGGNADAVVEKVSVIGQHFSEALRITTKAKPKNPWDMQSGTKTASPVKKGDVMLAIISVRALETSDEMGEATAGLVFEKAGAPHTKSLDHTIKVGKEWKQFFIPFIVLESYDAAGAQCNIKYGYMPQTIEVAGISLINYGTSKKLQELPKTIIAIKYQGREPDAAWRKSADERIEKYRKGDLTVTVKDASGKPVNNASVAITMKRHAYHFGAALTAQLLTADSDDGRKYRDIVEANFNKVVLENDLKYGPWEYSKTTKPSESYNISNTFKALQWLKERGILVRGHTFIWGPLDPRFYPKSRGFDLDGGNWEAMKKKHIAHIDEKESATKDYIYEWDVLNHPVATWGDKGRTWETVLGRDFYFELFRHARTLNPNQLLYINEGSDFPGDNEDIRAKYEKLIGDIIAAGAPIDGIGFMSHFGEASLNGMDNIYGLIDRYAKFGLKLQATELDVGTGGDEAGQADYYRDFITMFFSHPSTVGIIMWGFWEGRHWFPERALWRKNWDIKPCGQAWLDLVKLKWWTDVKGATDMNGSIAARGFLGDYEITVTAGGKKKTVRSSLPKDGATVSVTLD